jgi:hypothetical protein
MELFRAMAMPFQAQSLLFALIPALVITVVRSVGGDINPLTLLATYIVLMWLNRVAFAMLDAAANGERQAPVASVEMLGGVWSDPRSWVHPLLAAGVVVALLLQPKIPALPVIIGAAALFPLSLAAIVFTDRMIDAVNPLALWRTLRGLAQGYLILLCALALCVGTAWVLWRLPVWPLLRYLVAALLVFCFYAFTGGVLFWRRNALGFSPRHSPERTEEKQEAERAVALQRVVDDVFIAVRARKLSQAMTALNAWFDTVPADRRSRDLQAVLCAGPLWNEPRGLLALMDALIEKFCAERQVPLALGVAEQAMKQSPQFLPARFECTAALIRHAAHNGRRRFALQLLETAAARAGEENAQALAALRAELEPRG